MSRPIEFFFDYGSPYSYLADTQLPALADRHGAELVYRPFLIGGVFKATGNQSPAMETIVPKRAYGASTMQRWVSRYGVPFASNPFFPINTLPLMRLCVAAQLEGVFDPFHRAVFPAFWVDGANLGEPEVISELLGSVGLDVANLVERSGQDDAKKTLRANTDEAVSRGAFGAPTCFLGEEMFFGADHLTFLEEALKENA
jgi:2-hydroxychromene-2-carboxylate isomerase